MKFQIPLLSALLLIPASAETLYVDSNASGSSDGTSWGDAFPGLQPALAAAIAGDEIWVAQGTYIPGTSETDTFLLKPEVALYGGFSGGESFRHQRDAGALTNATFLSGEIGDPEDRIFKT